MRVGLIVDGEAEFASIRRPLDRAQIAGLTIVGPALTKITPLAPAPAFAAECKKQIRVIESRQADRIVVVLDREQRQTCCGAIAEEYLGHLQKCTSTEIMVVIKNSMYENWLVADLDALGGLRARFDTTNALRRRIAPNKADSIDALASLKSAAIGRQYAKVEDSKRIMDRAEALKIGANSRSFRRLLRCLDHPTYHDQSKKPIIPT